VPPRRNLEELARLFAAARAVVGLDTGLTHLAAALGVPTVGIYCASDPALTGLYGAPQARNVGSQGRAPSVDEVRRLLA
jgi:heptosyltransferase-1